MMQRTPRTDAIFDLLREARKTRTTQAGINRAVRACSKLGMTRAETLVVLRYLDVVNDSGVPFVSGTTVNFPTTMLEA